MRQTDEQADDNPLWYKDAIIYELHVRSFHDRAGDGTGDIRGLTEKLDYLKDLGVTVLWLLPMYPSPLRDDGYDIADYTNIHPSYGVLRDFQIFLREAHKRGLRVITELVLNHTSDQHPWFQRARRAVPGSRWRDFYVWSDTPERYKEARIIFKDFETSNWAWDPVAKAYYWHRFYSHQPDLNYNNPLVQRAILRVVDFWMNMGVDGMRLDAVPYLYEREGTNCENLPESHAFLKRLRRHIDQKFKNRMLLAEANQWPEDASAYFGEGDESHMAYHFPVMPRLFMGIRLEDRFPIIEILRQTPAIPESSQWALFLRNHDELTLEMVTDEERDYMYRVYAHDPQAQINLGIRRRLAPLLSNNRRRIELMNGLLFSLPGTPIIYYGDEIGMGDNIYLGDRNSVRTPMQWNGDRNAGFSRSNPQKLYLPVIIDPEYHFEAINVETQQNNPHSLLWWMKRLIALRKRYKAFGRGTIEFLYPENRKILAFIRRYQGESILVIANLSRFVQATSLDLSAYKGTAPVELFGRTRFPAISDDPYFFTVGPHAFYWFALEPQTIEQQAEGISTDHLPTLIAINSWAEIFRGNAKIALEGALTDYLRTRRWFGGKARTIQTTTIVDVISIGSLPEQPEACIALVAVDYVEGESETYILPIAYASIEEAERLKNEGLQAEIARLHVRRKAETGILYDALMSPSFGASLLNATARRRRFKGQSGDVHFWPARSFHALYGANQYPPLTPNVVKAEQSNTSLVYGDRLILKMFRKLGEGTNPDLEILRFLSEEPSFPNTPSLAGAIEYQRRNSEPHTLGILQGFVPNEGDAWQYTLDSLTGYFEQALARPANEAPQERGHCHILDRVNQETPALAYELMGTYLQSAELLGQRTAELHLALASASDNSRFSPEPFTTLYQQSLYQAMRNHTAQTLQLLRDRSRSWPEALREEASQILDREGEIFGRIRALTARKISALRIRCHGDYHLGQVLYTGNDFVIIDFEGEPARPLSERRIKRSPLRDVAGMLRSFHYATHAALSDQVPHADVRPTDLPSLEPWADFWYTWTSAAFLKSYLQTATTSNFLPQTREELETLLDAFLIEKAIYEVGYELNNRPDWIGIPVQGILHLLEDRPPT